MRKYKRQLTRALAKGTTFNDSASRIFAGVSYEVAGDPSMPGFEVAIPFWLTVSNLASFRPPELSGNGVQI